MSWKWLYQYLVSKVLCKICEMYSIIMLAFVMIYFVLYCHCEEANKVAMEVNEPEGEKHVNQKKQVSITSHYILKSLTQMQK